MLKPKQKTLNSLESLAHCFFCKQKQMNQKRFDAEPLNLVIFFLNLTHPSPLGSRLLLTDVNLSVAAFLTHVP